MNTLDGLFQHLLNQLHVSQAQAISAIEATAKIIAFKYEAELYKVFPAADIQQANTLGEAESFPFLRSRYLELTGHSSDELLAKITDEIVSSILQNPADYFKFTPSS